MINCPVSLHMQSWLVHAIFMCLSLSQPRLEPQKRSTLCVLQLVIGLLVVLLSHERIIEYWYAGCSGGKAGAVAASVQAGYRGRRQV